MFRDFDFESSSRTIPPFLSGKAFLNETPDRAVRISRAGQSDLDGVHALEQAIEGSEAASRLTLEQRLRMFRDGFLVAKSGDQVLGYLQSTLWHGRSFARFSDICDFPRWHTEDGRELYLIFLAVSPAFRSNGLASHLLACLKQLGRRYAVQRITLVAKEHLVPFYEKSGFQTVEALPEFLPLQDDVPYLMQHRLT